MATSCVLYHGPGAKDFAIAEANRIGRLVCPPIGDGGLKVDDARSITELLMSVPTGELVGVVIIGPMDEANPKSSDTLLKCLEEFPGEYTVPMLWANDLGSVAMTIRSRCLEKWVPALGDKDDDNLVTAAFKIIDAVTKADPMAAIDAMRTFDKREGELIAALSEALSTDLDRPDYRDIWERLRVVATWRNPFISEIFISLCQG